MTVNSVPSDPNVVDTTGETTFDELAAAMPETAQGFLDVPLPPSGASEDSGGGGGILDSDTGDTPPPERKKVNVSKSVRRAMNRFKGKAANVPIMWFHQQAKGNPTWELDDEEKELLTESIKTVFDVLDVEVEIQPLSWTLTSVWWVLGYPFLAFAFLFLTKKSLVMEAEQRERAKDAV